MDLTRFLKNCSLCMKMADKRNYTEVDSQIGEFDLRKIIFEVLFVKFISGGICEDCKGKVIDAYKLKKIAYAAMEKAKNPNSVFVIEAMSKFLYNSDLSDMAVMTNGRKSICIIPRAQQSKVEKAGWSKFEGKPSRNTSRARGKQSTPTFERDESFDDSFASCVSMIPISNSTLINACETTIDLTAEDNPKPMSTQLITLKSPGILVNRDATVSNGSMNDETLKVLKMLKDCKTSEGRWKCNICEDKKFISQFGLRVHLKRNHSIGLSNSSNLEEFSELELSDEDRTVLFRMILQSEAKPDSEDFRKGFGFSCVECMEKRKTFNDIRLHIYEKHMQVKPPKVSIIPLAKPSQDVFLKPTLPVLKKVKKQEKQQKCASCSTVFKTKKDADTHACQSQSILPIPLHSSTMVQNNSTGALMPRLSVSLVCMSASQLNGSNLTLPCRYCKTFFKNKAEKKAHIKDCKERKYLCHHCPKRFGSKTMLHIHLKKVLDIKDIKCQICRALFHSRSELKKHLTNVHVQSFMVQSKGQLPVAIPIPNQTM